MAGISRQAGTRCAVILPDGQATITFLHKCVAKFFSETDCQSLARAA
jgi:hypothetical protein